MESLLFQELKDNLGRDLTAFLPELILCGSLILLLLLRFFSALNRLHLGYVALVLSALAFVVSWLQWTGDSLDPRPEGTSSLNIFTGLLVYDNFTIFLKLFLTGFVVLVIWLTLLTRIPDSDDSADFYCLLLGATVGMALMASANHLLMIFIAVEMASLPSYAMAGFLKGRRQSSEAALKYVVYGGGAAGVMLYGISLLAGRFGTAYLPDLAAALVSTPLDAMLVLGVLFILIGFAFKLSAVPFHFWCPDVFEGAAAEVGAFLSVASKGAALALTGRFTLILAGMSGVEATALDIWENVAPTVVPALGVVAAITATFGNLAAFTQTNLKRLLAYSTIAHAGYMMMGLVTLTRDGASAVLFYLVAYIFMNLGAFGVVAFLRNLTGSEDLRDYRGAVQRAPVLVLSLAVFMLSLLGIPPLVGFAAKFQIFRVLYESSTLYAGQGMPGLSSLMIALLVIGGVNSVISLFYYVKVIKVMIVEKPLEEVEGQPAEPYPVPVGATIFAGVMALCVLALGILWNPLAETSNKGVAPFQDLKQLTKMSDQQLAQESQP